MGKKTSVYLDDTTVENVRRMQAAGIPLSEFIRLTTEGSGIGAAISRMLDDSVRLLPFVIAEEREQVLAAGMRAAAALIAYRDKPPAGGITPP